MDVMQNIWRGCTDTTAQQIAVTSIITPDCTRIHLASWFSFDAFLASR